MKQQMFFLRDILVVSVILKNKTLEQTNANEMKHTLKVKNINREEFLEKYQEKIEDKQGKKR